MLEAGIPEDAAQETDNRAVHILRPFNTLRNIYSPRTVLVIASENSLNVPDDLKTFTQGDNGVHVRFTTRLPLTRQDNHPPIDLVVLVYKVFHGDSLRTIKESLHLIDVRYFVGKCFILVTSDMEFCRADTDEIETLASSYNLPIHYVPKVKVHDKPGPARLQIPSSLMSIYCPSMTSDVSSLVIGAAVTRGANLLRQNNSVTNQN